MLQLLIITFLGVCYATEEPHLCNNKQEIIQPISDFYKTVYEMKSPLVDKASHEQISKLVYFIEEHYKYYNRTCGHENTDGMGELYDFIIDITKILDIPPLGFPDDTNVVKELFENFGSKQIRQYFITQIYSFAKNFDIVIKVTQLIKNNINTINEMHEAIINLLNDTNIHFGKQLVPTMKEIITQNDAEEPLSYAKCNLKKLVEKSAYNYSEALVLLNEIDSETAAETVEEIIPKVFKNYIYSKAFNVVNNSPTVHLKALALKALHEKINSMNLQNNLVSAKVYSWSKNLTENAAVINKADNEILNNIIQNATKFSANLIHGFSCRSIEEIESFTTNKEEERRAKFLVLQNTDHPQDIVGVLKVTENGSMLKINIETKHHTDSMKYSLILDYDDYEDLTNLSVVSKQRFSFENLTSVEICRLHPQPEFDICIPMSKYLNYTHYEAIAVRKQSYEILKEFINTCNKYN